MGRACDEEVMRRGEQKMVRRRRRRRKRKKKKKKWRMMKSKKLVSFLAQMKNDQWEWWNGRDFRYETAAAHGDVGVHHGSCCGTELGQGLLLDGERKDDVAGEADWVG